MIYIIIYLIGYVLAYYLGRYYRRSRYKHEDSYSYNDVILNATGAIFSWLWLCTLACAITSESVTNKKPPKWL